MYSSLKLPSSVVASLYKSSSEFLFFHSFLFQILKTRMGEDHALLIAKLEFFTGNFKNAWDIYKGIKLEPRPNDSIRIKTLRAEVPFIQGSFYLVTVFVL